MKKSLIISSILAVGLSGCASFKKPYLYGEKSCENNQRPYVYAKGNAAICLDQATVAYMICVREFGITSTDTGSISSADLSANIAQQGAAAAKYNFNNTEKVTFSSSGDVAKATARAIDTCERIYNSYRNR